MKNLVELFELFESPVDERFYNKSQIEEIQSDPTQVSFTDLNELVGYLEDSLQTSVEYLVM